MECARNILSSDLRGKRIAIYSDSHAAIKALGSYQCNSKFTWECIKVLSELGMANRLTIARVPGHRAIYGNEVADRLVKEAASTSVEDPEPFCGLPRCYAKKVHQGKD